MRPDYRKGDVIVPVEGNGCNLHLFVAEHEPAEVDGYGYATPGKWWYCFASANQYRKANPADVVKVLGAHRREIAMKIEELESTLRLSALVGLPAGAPGGE